MMFSPMAQANKSNKNQNRLRSFLLSQKKRTKRKPADTGRLPGRGLPMMFSPMAQANISNKNQNRLLTPNPGSSRFFLYFSFGSKEKYQKKTTIYLAFAGAWVPNDVQPHGSGQYKQQKPKPAFRSSTWVEAGFSLVLSFSLKKKERRFFFCFFSF